MMRRERSFHHRPIAIGRSLARTWIVVAMALIALVNILYIWPIKLGPAPAKRATSSVASIRVHARKDLADSLSALVDDLPRYVVHLHCADQSAVCEEQRHSGRCSTHLLDDFHTCPASCGVCPALELAVRSSMNLTAEQLVVVRQPGPPSCVDDISWCGQLGAAEEECTTKPLQLVGVCKAACGACLKPAAMGLAGKGGGEAVLSPSAGTGRIAHAKTGGIGDAGKGEPNLNPVVVAGADDDDDNGGGGDDGSGCFDAVDMCAWWAKNDPRVCQRVAEDLQAWWWVAVACRRSCGLCGSATATAIGTTTATATATATDAAAGVKHRLVSAARLGVQVGEAPDGSPRVAVFEEVSDEPGACGDSQPQCATWAAAGECRRNPGFMNAACPKTCGTCPVIVNLKQPLAKVRLNNGVLQPTVGYGCAGLGDSTSRTVRWALEAGYRHLDSAQAREWYREDLVGKALSEFLKEVSISVQQGRGEGAVSRGARVDRGSGGLAGSGGVVRRQDIFVTSKLHPRHLGYETTLRQFNASLRDLHTSYVDLFLLHYAECWGNLCEGAVPKGNFFDSWRALEELYEAGLVRAIGVSNFSPDQLSKLLASARIRPAVLQVHVDPLERNEALQALCRHEGVVLTAYSTLGTQWGGSHGNPVLGHPVLQAIGQEVVAAAAAAVAAAAAAGNGNGSGGGGGSRSAAQVALRWALQQGLVVLPRSSNQGRIRENLQLYDWGLSAAHIRQIAHLKPAT
ncbi:hypothetical protein Vafri_20666 [Volvox africanus]|uniref:ShKT domain-containing protein n=1 Tax=Volvox africanus TaxID=51714 RepID=A0A8J4FAM0_9CHLO|nr:hypothetical protein Vafri_20666 [Volvox africanus]